MNKKIKKIIATLNCIKDSETILCDEYYVIHSDFIIALEEEIQQLQQELQRKDNNWNELKEYIKNIDDNENSFGDYEIDYRTKQELLDKIKELENDN